MDFRILGPLEVRDGDREVRAAGRQGTGAAGAAARQRESHARARSDRRRALGRGRARDGAEDGAGLRLAPAQGAGPGDPPHAPARLRARPRAGAARSPSVRASRDGGARGAGRRPRPSRRQTGFARRCRSGGGPRSPSSRPSRSHSRRGRGSKSVRMYALEGRLEAELALGHHRDVVGELEALIAQHPLRERLRSQHMLALYRSGRHAEALASYQTFRRTLSEELGIEPSASLRELERQILQQDPITRAAGAHGHARLSAHAGQSEPRARTSRATSPTREAATSGSPTRSSATGRSTSFSSTAGSAPSSPGGNTRSSQPSTGGSRRWGGSSSSTSAAPASPTASHPSTCPTSRRAWTTFVQCSTPSARNGRSCSASPKEDRCRRSSPRRIPSEPSRSS